MKNFLVGIIALVLVACAPSVYKQIAKSVIDVALAACLAENPGKEKPELKEICHWTDEADPFVDNILASSKKGLSKYSASKTTVTVEVDAGPDAAKASAAKPDGGK